jgi:hypothetical protein
MGKSNSKSQSVKDGRTPSQEKAFKQVLSSQIAVEKKGRSGALKTAWQRGGVATRLIKRKEEFGPVSAEEIAAHLGVKRLTVQQSAKFNGLVTRQVMGELCSLERPPSWRMMSQWVSIKDPGKQKRVLQDILSGNLAADGFEAALRTLLGRGPKKPRRPTGCVPTLRRLSAEASSMSQHFEWLPKVSAEVKKLSDPAAQREVRGIAKETLQSLKSMAKDLKRAIDECGKFAKD